MKKIALLLFVVCITSTAFQCDSPTPGDSEKSNPCSNPEWMTNIIKDIEERGLKGEVIQYQYNGGMVFYVDICHGCADDMTTVYNCAGETKCQFGGIAGFNTCPDFQDKATDKKIIWSN